MQLDDPSTRVVSRSSFTSADESEITDFIAHLYADNSTRFSAPNEQARFSASTWDVDGLGADRVRSSLDYSGTSEEGFADFVTILVNSGVVNITSRDATGTASAGQVTAYPVGAAIDFTVQQVDVTSVRLPASTISACARELTGLPGERLRFHAITPLTPAMGRYWRALTTTISGALADPDSPLTSPLLAEQMAQSAAVAALHVFPNTTMDHHHRPGPGAVGPATLRRAVAYIEAHADQPVTLSQVADASGTSARALQHAFRHHLQTTPMGHLRQVRLHRAHRDLEAADPRAGDTVAAVAARWGFTNFGRFTTGYREAFGELPRQTLRS